MINKKSIAIAITATCLSVTYPQDATAQNFTSAQIVDWPQESRQFYFRTSIGMAGLITRQNNEVQADCIDGWYFGDETRAQAHILDVMGTYPTYHPLGVIIAILEKRCGPLRYANR